MNWIPDPLAQLASAQAESELEWDRVLVRHIAAELGELIDRAPRAASAGEFSGWLGPARRSFDARQIELQALLVSAADELDALQGELGRALVRTRDAC